MSPTPMTVFLLGATGGIGRQVLTRLLDRGCHVTAIVRCAERLPAKARSNSQLLTVIEDPNGHMGMTDLRKYVQCDAIVQCLGHNMSFKGVFGYPRRLCAMTTQRLCEDIHAVAPDKPVKLIVINTEGVSRPDGGDSKTLRRSCCESFILNLLTWCLPPHADNVATLAYLHHEARKNPHVSFCAVRPSDLINDEPSDFSVHETLQNGILNAGATSRANVAEFMANLVTKPQLWERWANTFPHILNAAAKKKGADDGPNVGGMKAD